MKLTDDERAMLDGRDGAARRKAMELLVRYGEALNAERFVEATNVAGVPGTSNPFLENYYREPGDRYDVIYSRFDLDSDEVVEVPRITVHACHLQGGIDPENWQTLGAKPEHLKISQAGEASAASHGIKILKTCTPYLAGNVPARGEHCAWMESSAVVYCNSVLAARTNTEGRESTSAAMLTGRIPDWGFHRDDFRLATHHIEVDVPVDDILNWGMLGYFAGDAVGERIPVLTGKFGTPGLIDHKHFGAAAASSGGVEMYHMVGVTPESPSLEASLGCRRPVESIHYGKDEQRKTYETLNARGKSADVDFVMLGCPHYSLDQVKAACRLIGGRTRQREQQALDLHLARGPRGRGPRGLHQAHPRRGRGAPHRHLLGDRSSRAARDQGRCARLRQADPLLAGHHGHRGLVRDDCRLYRCSDDRPVEWKTSMSAPDYVLKGRKVVGGCVEGEALVTTQTISGWGGVNPMAGTVIETRHELRGVSFKDKILVFPGAKGSSGWSAVFHMTRLAGVSPKALIFNEMTTKVALGAVVMRVPSITDLDQDPLALIETGDWVKVDADRGLVEVRKKSKDRVVQSATPSR